MASRVKRLRTALALRTTHIQWFRWAGIALCLVGIGLALWYNNAHSGHSEDWVLTQSDVAPDETKPPASYAWRGQSDDPKYLRIPQLGVDAFVRAVGVDQQGAMAVPNNIHLGGWFNGSARPGAKGLSIIAGHVDGKSMPGVFHDLSALKKGDTFEVELGNGTHLNYRVFATITAPVADAAQQVFSQSSTVSSQLNLVTCTGTFQEGAGYTDRIIVMAELVGP